MRAQSHVVGVALMLGLAVVALGALTVSVGTIVDSQASNADTTRVAEDFTDAVEAVERTGVHSNQISFSSGELRTARRTVRIIENRTVVERRDVNALVFEHGDQRVTAIAGAVIRGTENNAWLVAPPPIISSAETRVLVVGLPIVGGEHVTVSGTGGVTATLRTNVSHVQRDLGTGHFAVAIETETPAVFERYFEAQNATTERRVFANDRTQSVVAHYPERWQGYLVEHDLSVEVTHG